MTKIDYQIGLESNLYITGGEYGDHIQDDNTHKGFIKFNRSFDDCNIESHAVGAVPYNFVPLPHRTPSPTTDETT